MAEKNCINCNWFERYINFQDSTKEEPGMCVNIKQKDHFLNDVNDEITCSEHIDIFESTDNEIQNNTDYEYPELEEDKSLVHEIIIKEDDNGFF